MLTFKTTTSSGNEMDVYECDKEGDMAFRMTSHDESLSVYLNIESLSKLLSHIKEQLNKIP